MRKLDATIEGTTTDSKIRRAVFFGTWDDLDHATSGGYGSKHTALFKHLAQSILAERTSFLLILPDLVSKRGFRMDLFGWCIGEQDAQFASWPVIAEAFWNAGNERNPEFIRGYLNAMFHGARDRWERTVLATLDDDQMRPYTRNLIIASGLTEPVLDAVCTRVEESKLSPASLTGIYSARRNAAVSDARWLEFMRWCIQRNDTILLRAAFDTAYYIFCADKPGPLIVEHPILELLTSPHTLELGTGEQHGHEWTELATRFLAQFPGHSIKLFESIIERLRKRDFALGLRFSLANKMVVDLIRSDPKGCWRVVEENLESLDSLHAGNILFWLGPSTNFGGRSSSCALGAFDVADVLGWIDADPSERAIAIARACPKSLDPAEGGELARQILICYGDRERVPPDLHCNFYSEGISGSRSDHYRAKRERFSKWLANETAQPIIAWLENEIDRLGAEIAAAEIDEERRY